MRLLVLSSFFLLLVACKAKKESAVAEPKCTEITWLTIQEAEKLNKEHPKKIFIDLYTDWCGYCKIMDSKTFSDPRIKEYICANFYAVKFNAERTDTVTFNNDTLVNLGVPFGKRASHQFATKYGSTPNGIGYPTSVFMNASNQLIQNLPGYYSPEQFIICLKYINEEHYKTKTLETYYNEEILKVDSTYGK